MLNIFVYIFGRDIWRCSHGCCPGAAATERSSHENAVNRRQAALRNTLLSWSCHALLLYVVQTLIRCSTFHILQRVWTWRESVSKTFTHIAQSEGIQSVTYGVSCHTYMWRGFQTRMVQIARDIDASRQRTKEKGVANVYLTSLLCCWH